jgi:hypothetical protein
MLAATGFGAAEVAPLWSMSTGGCGGGQFDTYCTPYSGSAGKAYNCVGCSPPNQATIQALQGTLANLAAVLGAQGEFGAGRTVTADKVIGMNTARAVGILGKLAMAKGLAPSPTLGAVIAMCASQRANFEAGLVGNHSVQIAIQNVAKHAPALFAYFGEALRRFGGALPTPPSPQPPGPTPVVDFDRGPKIRALGFAGMLFIGASTALMLTASSTKKRRRR